MESNNNEIMNLNFDKYENLEMLASFIKNSLISIIITDKDGDIVFANSKFKEITGYSEGEIIGNNSRFLKSHKMGNSVYEDLWKTILSGQTWSGDLLNKHKNGELYWERIFITPVFDKNNEISHFIAQKYDINTQKLFEEKIAETEERYRLAFSTSPDSININSFDGIFIDINVGFTNITGFTREDVIGKSSDEINIWKRPEDREKLIEGLKKDGRVENLEAEFRFKNGIVKYGLMSASIISINGEPHILSVTKDISERKYLEHKIKDSEESYRNLIEFAPDAFVQCDAEGKFVNANNVAVEMTGYSKDELLKMNMSDLFPIEIMKSNPLRFDLLNEGKTIKTVREIVRKDGNQIPIEMNSKKLPDGSYQSFIRDISERTKINEHQIRLTSAIENSREVIFITDLDGIIVYINPEFTKLYGFTKDEVIGKVTPRILKSGLSTKENVEYLWKTLLNKQRIISEYVNKTKDGRSLDIEGSSVAILNEKDDIIGFMGIQRDITERKRGEEALLEQNKLFESQYEEYMQLNEVLRQTNEDLEIAKSKSEGSDRLKTAFLQNISHEIRTPLNGIIGFSKLLNNRNNTLKEIEEFAGMIQQSGDRLIETINNVLEISKIETGQIEIINKFFSINSLITDLYSQFYTISNSVGLVLESKMALVDDDSIIFSDESKLNQILISLIINAIKFTPKGKIKFGYELEKDQLKFFVQDTGIGIAKELHKKIFDRFTQAEDGIGRSFEGAGLGLAICKGLVEKMDGDIWLESEIEIGTTFYFRIPIKIKNNNIKKFEESLVSREKEKNIKILVAEDDFTSFQFICKVLKNNNYEIINAKDGKQAVELTIANPDISLVLMDIRMPIINGFEATKEIKKIRPDLPIIAQTAFAFSEDREKILAAGCDDYISKPIEINKLLKMIDKYLQ